METPPNIHTLLKHYGLRPRKSLGQNFLVDEAALQRVVDAAEIEPDQSVLEIGPGLGHLTRLLAARALRVVCVELDPALIAPLKELLADWRNVEIIHGDILRLDPSTLMAAGEGVPPYQVVANIPYYITSALMRHLLETRCPPDRLILTVQGEVAERICAEPGEMSLLALSVQVYGQPLICGRIPAGSFYPPPRVDSAIIRVRLYSEPMIPESHRALFFRLAKAGFSQKRKTLRNSLSGGMHWNNVQTEALLLQAGIDPMRRAETVNLDEWKSLTMLVADSSPEEQ